MKPISTISEFLLQAGTQYQVFDLSRGIRPLSAQQFLDIEMAQQPHPTPRQQSAWFGVIFKNKQLSEQHYIWFIKLPLDEKGLVIEAARNDFLNIIVTALGRQLEKNADANGQLPENPYTFVPSQQQLADFNSISRHQLGLAASDYLSAAQQYFTNPLIIDWQTLALQGISDFVVYTPISELTLILEKQLTTCPAPVRTSLLSSLENISINKRISQILIDWAKSVDARDSALALRALSQSTASSLVRAFIEELLAPDQKADMDILVVIAGRHWQHLESPDLLELLMNKLAEHNADSSLFNGIFADLVQIPALRTLLLNLIRQPQKSESLTRAIGQLFSQQGKAANGI